MSTTIRHPVQSHTWWYAAAAVAILVGLLAVLMTMVFHTSQAPTTIVPPPTSTAVGHAYGAPCFAGHPVPSIELIRSGCRG
jgi:hypothetical protein